MDGDAYVPMELPGGGGFEDVTELFQQAADEMKPGELVMMLSLMESMSAFEIGEPRMDSGMILEEDDKPPFDPLAPLLPQEICWILDRAFACESEWHAGNTLSQTVFTLLYVHSLADINPELLPPGRLPRDDPTRPPELITLVLRAGVFGLLKSCDLAWRELSRRRVYDTEDWQSEKCEVSLFEGVPVDMVLRKLDEACVWLHNSSLPPEWRDALFDRIILRKTMLQLLNLAQTDELDDIRPLTTIAKSILRRIKGRPPPTLDPNSAAFSAFDPRVNRRLQSMIPLCVLDLPPQEKVWVAIEQFLDGLDNIDYLQEHHTLSAWEANGSLGVWLPSRGLSRPYVRSLTQSVFLSLLASYPERWIVEQFFWETVGFSYESISDLVINTWAGEGELMLQEVQSHIVEVVSNHIKSFWFNPPRRRRHLMRSMQDWQLLHDALSRIVAMLVVSSTPARAITTCLPAAVESWKLSVAREIILAGFQQELYPAHERPLAYWCLVYFLQQHLTCLERMKPFIPTGTFARRQIDHQMLYLLALLMICMALCGILSAEPTPDRDRIRLNFRRRYKWLYAGTSDEPDAMLFPFPTLESFHEDMERIKGEPQKPTEYLRQAKESLARLADSPYDDPEAHGRSELVRCLASVADELLRYVEARNSGSDVGKLRWDPSHHPWFPTVLST